MKVMEQNRFKKISVAIFRLLTEKLKPPVRKTEKVQFKGFGQENGNW